MTRHFAGLRQKNTKSLPGRAFQCLLEIEPLIHDASTSLNATSRSRLICELILARTATTTAASPKHRLCPALQTLLDEIRTPHIETVVRKHRQAESAGLLASRLFDDRGNRLTPSHTNKTGQRHRYYVTQAVLQNNKGAAGAITQIAAPRS